MIRVFFGFNKHIVDINFHGLAYQWTKYLCDQSLIGCSCVLQTKRHHIVVVQPVWRNEGRFLRIRRMHRNLVVAGEGVHK